MEYELLCTLVRHPSMVLTREMLLRQVRGDEYIGETRTVDVHVAALRTERLSQKMMQLIAMADAPMLALRHLDTSALFSQVCTVMEAPLLAKGLTLHTDIQACTLRGDADLLTCLLTNLVDNAIKASQQIIQRRMAQPVMETLAPSQDLQFENNSLTT